VATHTTTTMTAALGQIVRPMLGLPASCRRSPLRSSSPASDAGSRHLPARMVNVRPLHPRPPFDPRQRVGDLVVEVARRYAAQMNGCEFATLLRSRRLDKRRYVAFIANLYPCVIGFNRALIRSIVKVDHVLHSSFIKALAEHHAANVLRLIREIQRTGATSLHQIADALNARGISTPRGEYITL